MLYYLQYNTQSYLQFNTQKSVVLPAIEIPICRITCNEIPDVLYYLQSNTQPYLQFYNQSFVSYYLQYNT